jgi:hypothetical protein
MNEVVYNPSDPVISPYELLKLIELQPSYVERQPIPLRTSLGQEGVNPGQEDLSTPVP